MPEVEELATAAATTWYRRDPATSGSGACTPRIRTTWSSTSRTPWEAEAWGSGPASPSPSWSRLRGRTRRPSANGRAQDGVLLCSSSSGTTSAPASPYECSPLLLVWENSVDMWENIVCVTILCRS
ncbi:hypothetical protein D1007_26404 [Hordeum vulgare]|nr:hypothetical protein D1007_26404 [Hordeum vulgare]